VAASIGFTDGKAAGSASPLTCVAGVAGRVRDPVGTPQVLMSQSDGTITIALPEPAFGTPATGWGFTVVLTGQDGFSSDQARGFAPTAQPFLFGVCAPGGAAAICSADPATMPKAVDVSTPEGVSQDTELDPTRGPVAIQPVTVP
jgi:glucoamylase